MRGFRQQWNVEAGSRADLEARGLLGTRGHAAPSRARAPYPAGATCSSRRSRPTGGPSATSPREAIRLRVRSGGWAFVMRFQRGTLARFHGHGVDDRAADRPLALSRSRAGAGVFERDRVRVETDDGEVVAERDEPARRLPAGCATTSGGTTSTCSTSPATRSGTTCRHPFMFTRPGFELDELRPWDENGERWRRLHVRFPRRHPYALARAGLLLRRARARCGVSTTPPRCSGRGRRQPTIAGTTRTSPASSFPRDAGRCRASRNRAGRAGRSTSSPLRFSDVTLDRLASQR